MPARWFCCPDGGRVRIQDCLMRCRCLDEHGLRCAPRGFLAKVAQQRTWRGVPSTTQLIRGTRQAYLEITEEYAIDPRDRAYAILGTAAHRVLEAHDDNALVEEHVTVDGVSGVLDRLEPHPAGGYILTDWKTTGAYKVRAAMGHHQVDVKTGDVYKTGPRKGKPKTRKEWRTGGVRQVREWAIQMNRYRMAAEEAGFPVRVMRIYCILRDAGTRYGYDKPTETIIIRRISDRWMRRWYDARWSKLYVALVEKRFPPVCRLHEKWGGARGVPDGRKCQRYCEVADVCKKKHAARSGGKGSM